MPRPSERGAPDRRARRRRWLALGAALVGLGAAAAGVELAFRAALFGDGVLADALGPRLRFPRDYADATSDDAYWKLQVRFLDETRFRDIERPDPTLGWLGPRIDPETYAAEAFAPVGDRRKVLLYGDSFAACAEGSRRADCFEGLLERSDLADRFALLNYGVHGYGLDQIYLLLRSSLAAHAPDDPLVAVGILVDDDLDRVVLGFRGWPKPRFQLAEDGLVLGPPLPPRTADYLRDHPLDVPSYAWRYFVHASGLLPAKWRRSLSGAVAAKAEKIELSRALLAAIADELQRHGAEAFFVLFHGWRSVASAEPYTWRERLLVDFLEERRLPYVSTKRHLRADARATGRSRDAYFLVEGTEARHYSGLGNEVAFRALRRGLEGVFDGVDRGPGTVRGGTPTTHHPPPTTGDPGGARR